MHFRPKYMILYVIILAIGFPISGSHTAKADNPVTKADSRYTPLVRAVQNCKRSVVNLRGRKSVPADSGLGSQKLKQVNGMGTGVVIDSRGYVLTNYHVVQGVKVIEVTTADRKKTTAQLLAHDPETDLAIIKIKTSEPLPTIKIGTSSDLMLAEQVAAVGNAYGYEHTVTLGIVSALKRTVQVNDDQIYRNLIQTDTAINPGNSGGPLLNMNGEMIGINVAVRIGAQGIAFAIPVNDAVEVAAKLMSEIVPSSLSHGLSTRTTYVDDRPQLVIDAVKPNSSAAKIGLTSDTTILSINGRKAVCELDLLTSMIDPPNNTLRMRVASATGQRDVALKLRQSRSSASTATIGWLPLGVKVRTATSSEMKGRHPNYKKGLKILSVRGNSPAEKEGIMPGDVLVAMHGWKTESVENLAYILQRDDIANRKNFKFFILRDKEPFWGQMRVANLPTR